jgi:hypothetical protein
VLNLLVVVALVALVALVIRFRRSRGIERQQLKWFTFAGALAILGLFGADFFKDSSVADVLTGLLVAFVPVSAGIAILRYRLYEIDRLVNRALVYGLVTAILGLGYAGAVLTLGEVFGGVAGNPPSWAVAGATLAVAALFQPARRHSQAVVDRRFNRQRYNAAKTIQGFSARLRDEVDLEALATELLVVAGHTMQPTTASLWLRPSAHASLGGRGRGSQPNSDLA